jgi:hypothetical protein
VKSISERNLTCEKGTHQSTGIPWSRKGPPVLPDSQTWGCFRGIPNPPLKQTAAQTTMGAFNKEKLSEIEDLLPPCFLQTSVRFLCENSQGPSVVLMVLYRKVLSYLYPFSWIH